MTRGPQAVPPRHVPRFFQIKDTLPAPPMNQPETEIVVDTPPGSPVRQLSVFLHNRVGALMSLVKLLGDNAIEVLGFSLQEFTEMTLARLVVSDPETTETLFMERGIAHSASVAVVVEIKEGSLAACLSALLAAEINIRVCFPLMARPGRGALVAFILDEPEIGADVLNKAGFHVLMQEELSR